MSAQQRTGEAIHPQAGAIAPLLVKESLLTNDQLSYAIRVRSKLASNKTIIDIIQELGYVTGDQVRDVLRKNRVAIRMGDLLVELGYLRESDLQAALNLQKEGSSGMKLGDLLVAHGFIDERKLLEVLAYQLGFPQVELEFRKLDRKLFVKAPFQTCREFLFVPVVREGAVVTVAFADPLDRKARETAESIFGKEISPAIASKLEILDALTNAEKNATHAEAGPADENTVIGIINTLFEDAISENASDIHIEPMKDRIRIRFRRDGVMMQHRDLPLELAPQVSSRIKVMAQADIAEKRRHQDGRILFESRKHGFNLDLRVSFYITIFGEKIVLRLLNKKGSILEINDIGMAPRMLEHFIYDALDTPTGVMIVTGPTGSGKTSTLYSCVKYLNNINTSIITAEDPVEFVIDGISQCSINPKIGVTFEETLRHIVRQDPDIIVLGEIRDTFSAETAIQAALTGHKVLTTFHTEDSIGGLIRLMNMEIEAFLISSTVVCVVAQRLLRLVCDHCAETYIPTPLEISRLGYMAPDLAGAEFREGRGCKECRFTGFKGRTAIFELLVLNEPVKEAILGNRSSAEIRRLSMETSGLVTLFEDGLVKAARGLVSIHEVLRDLPRISKPRPLHELKRILGI
ncbi:type II secretion system protein E [Geobacter sp. OR-1]|uniref:GspE/PulE family protein n=1 Tax=Geobacter sp. OR-1 TaxID=1266765 RepID=UPI000543F693|nr:GspE/PulE family protein [Geobacter sp. OR-1]GAM10124.1 type II secretion system protein E [Geobacter sp. OR-1]